MGCTSKVMGVAAILSKSMSDSALLSQRVDYTKKDLTNWNPVTEKHLSSGMTVAGRSSVPTTSNFFIRTSSLSDILLSPLLFFSISGAELILKD